MRKNNWLALASLILVSGGLASAAFSNPPNALNNPAGDRQSLLLGVAGFACTIVGMVLLVMVARETTKSMPPKKKMSTNICVGFGIILQLAAILAYRTGVVVAHPLVVPLGLFWVSLPVFVRGCMDYASGKGRSKWLGLVGVTGLVGLAILIILSEQNDDDAVDPADADRDVIDVVSQGSEN
ncbi:MAG: hypothetical protein VB859_15675 [Planctomycetaceae bacterium]